MPKVSVIIPVYNTEKYLEKCLESVCNQTLSDIEIICINDCSTDNSLEILNRYAAEDERIKIINFPENRGAAAARNAGIDVATGEYIGFVDSDDYPDLDFYEKLHNRAKETGADVAKGNYKSAHDGYVDEYLNEKIKEDKNNFAYAYCSAIFKRDIIIKNNLCFPDLSDMEDPVFTINFALAANKVEIVDTFVNIVKRENSLTASPSFIQIRDKIKGLSIIIDEFNSCEISSQSYAYVLSFWFWQTYINSTKNAVSEIRLYLAQELLNLFQIIKYKTEFLNELALKNDFLTFCLKTNNFNYLVNTEKSQMLYKLRKNIKELSYA